MTNPAITKLYEMRDAYDSWKEVARQLGVSAAYVSDVINGRREVSDKLARKLGCKKVVGYERVEER